MAVDKNQANDTVDFVTVPRGQPDFAKVLCSKENPQGHRGRVDGRGVVQAPCSVRYIQTLCVELFQARAFSFKVISEPAAIDQEAQDRRLQFLTHEVKRLLEHQALFPSAIVKARFLALFAIDGSHEFDHACARLLIDEEWRNYDLAWREQKNRPTYLKGSHGWENFLLNASPGLNLQPNKTNPESSFQVVPAIGARIVNDFLKEENAIVDFIENTDFDFNVAPAKTTGLVNFDDPHPYSERYPIDNLLHMTYATTNRDSPFKDALQPSHDKNQSSVDRFENFSTMGFRLERTQIVPDPRLRPINTPRLFPHILMRSFQDQGKGIQPNFCDEDM